MKSKPVYFVAVIAILAILIAACAPLTAAPASSDNPVPVTGSTATTAAPTLSAATSSAANPTSVATAANPAPTTASSGSTSTGKGVKYTLVAAKSEASYAVREQLARLNLPSDAIGKTNAISGSVTVNPDGSIDSANSKITVDLSTLQTDSAMRDGFVSRNILQTSQYPLAVFVPTQVTGLPAAIPQSGSVTFKVTGNMTIHNVTKPLTWDVTGSITNGEAVGTATTSFTFEDFNISQPQVPVVLSVVDKINLTVTVAFQPSAD